MISTVKTRSTNPLSAVGLRYSIRHQYTVATAEYTRVFHFRVGCSLCDVRAPQQVVARQLQPFNAYHVHHNIISTQRTCQTHRHRRPQSSLRPVYPRVLFATAVSKFNSLYIIFGRYWVEDVCQTLSNNLSCIKYPAKCRTIYLIIHRHCLSSAATSRLTSFGAVSRNIFHSCKGKGKRRFV